MKMDKPRAMNKTCNMSRLRRHPFNLVEIVLALAVLAIGISSVLVLFPVGVNANRDAVAGNNMSDLSEQIVSQIRAAVEADWEKTGFKASDKGFGKELDTKCPHSDMVESDFDVSGDNASLAMVKGADGVYLFRMLTQLESGEYVSDFAAVVQIWKDENFSNFYVADASSSSQKALTKADLENFAKVILVEISWPANLNYADREKAYFRYESFNNQFVPFTD